MYNYLMTIMLFCTGIVITLITIPMMMKMLRDSGLVRPNYRNDEIPVGMGIAFIPCIVINGMIIAAFNDSPEKLLKLFVFLFALMAMSFAGIMDDSMGNRDVTGLKGHFMSLFKGKMTTGGFKALLGGFVGLIVTCAMTDSIVEMIVGALVVALSTNLMNLLDLRPGRAIKVYFVISVIMLIFCSGFNREILMVIFPAVVAYFYYDLKALSMMGDAGSNVLGISIGVFMIMSYNLKVQIVWLVLLVVLHIVTEKYSLTKIIEKNRFLNFIDNIGR